MKMFSYQYFHGILGDGPVKDVGIFGQSLQVGGLGYRDEAFLY